MFDDFTTYPFPAEDCTRPNEREPEVRDSDVAYLCVLVDSRFKHEARLKVLYPYTCPDTDDKELILYGWTDGSNVYDHKERSIHEDRERVVAWKKVDTETDFNEMFKVDW